MSEESLAERIKKTWPGGMESSDKRAPLIKEVAALEERADELHETAEYWASNHVDLEVLLTKIKMRLEQINVYLSDPQAQKAQAADDIYNLLVSTMGIGKKKWAERKDLVVKNIK